MEEKASIIFLIHNAEQCLKDYFYKIKNKYDVLNCEYLLIDMGSNDNSCDICKNLQKEYSNVVYIQLYEHNIDYACFVGINAAEGEYIYTITEDNIKNNEVPFNIYENKDENKKENIKNKENLYKFYESCKVTLVLTCFNKEKYIERAINSVKNMNGDDWECVIVNNNSTDNSLNVILESIKNNKKFKLISQTNKNVCHSRNIGAYIGTGKYVTFLDGDDEIGKEFCEHSSDILENNDAISIVGGCFLRKYLNNRDELICTFCDNTPNEWYILDFCAELIINVFVVTSMLRMKRFKSINGFKIGTEYTQEDWEMFIRYLHIDGNKSNVYYIKNEISVIMYETEDSKTKTQNISWNSRNHSLLEMYNENKDIYDKILSREDINNIINLRYF